MSEPIRACAICRWCAWLQYQDSESTLWFHCRYGPPVVSTDEGSTDAWWPHVEPDAWCRLFELDPMFEPDVPQDQIDAELNQRRHFDPSRLVRLAFGMIEETAEDRHHLDRCDSCHRVYKEYRRTMSDAVPEPSDDEPTEETPEVPEDAEDEPDVITEMLTECQHLWDDAVRETGYAKTGIVEMISLCVREWARDESG